MTVCIGAIARGRNEIVMVMDQMLTVGDITADMPDLAKGMRIHRNWFAMFAGDLEYASPIMRNVTNVLARENSIPSVQTVVDVFLQAYRQHRLRIVEQTVLGLLGLTNETFAEMIATDDNEILRGLVQKANNIEFNVEFLVCGFDANPSARIFTITPPGVEGHYDDIGFWSIGSGSESAINNLSLRGYNQDLSLSEAVYQVAESKFVAESAVYVGKRTAIVVLKADGRIGFITKHKLDDIRKIWYDEGRPPMPLNLDERIDPLIRFINPPPMPKPSDSQTSESA